MQPASEGGDTTPTSTRPAVLGAAAELERAGEQAGQCAEGRGASCRHGPWEASQHQGLAWQWPAPKVREEPSPGQVVTMTLAPLGSEAFLSDKGVEDSYGRSVLSTLRTQRASCGLTPHRSQ